MSLRLVHTVNSGPVFACDRCVLELVMTAMIDGYPMPDVEPLDPVLIPAEQACECCGRTQAEIPCTLSASGRIIAVGRITSIRPADGFWDVRP